MTLQKKMPDIFVFGIVTIVDCCFFGKHKYVLLLNLFNFIDILKSNFI